MTTSSGRVSGHYAGAFTRLAAAVIDWFIIIGVYGIILGGAQFLLDVFVRSDANVGDGDPLLRLIGLLVWAFVYLSAGLVITGRTLGKTLLGLKVVTRDGAPVGARGSVIRVLALPLSFLVFGLGFLGIVLGRERRALHDVIAGTAVVYDWGDRPAEMPAPLSRWLERRGVAVAAEPGEPAEET